MLGDLNGALESVGTALGPTLQARLGLHLTSCSDGFFACFPGDGSTYGAHTDGNSAGVKLTMIVYMNYGWQTDEHGGELLLLDERPAKRCWRAVEPVAGTLVVFLSEKVVHKVAPAHRTRFALTKFWMSDS